ncbi:MAG: 2'-5' RNA ligase family protein [Chloroflexota bacterium]
MYGVVSLLDGKYTAIIEEIWDTFQRNFGVHGVHVTPIPHFSYHVAENYDISQLDELLELFTRQIEPFTIRTSGLGIFTGPEPVLYIPVVPDGNLLSIHRRIWQAIDATAQGSSLYYQPVEWRPHITLTQGGVDHDMLPQVIRVLSERNFNWNIEIDNLSIIGGTPESEAQVHGLVARYDLTRPLASSAS